MKQLIAVIALASIWLIACSPNKLEVENRAEPRVEFVKKDNDSLQVRIFNETGMEFRTLIIPEGLEYDSEPNITDSSRWKGHRIKEKISDSRASAFASGRKTYIEEHTLNKVSDLVPASYDRKRIAVIIEWNDGFFFEWGKSKAIVYYYEIK